MKVFVLKVRWEQWPVAVFDNKKKADDFRKSLNDPHAELEEFELNKIE